MSKGTIFIIIIIVALLLTGVIVFGVIPSVKRKKLAQAWSEIATKAGLNLTPDYIRQELGKISNSEVDTLITFSKDLQAKKYVQAISMLVNVKEILNKTKLGNIETYLAALVGQPNK